MNTKPKKSNSNDIAKLAGVSQATVSRVLTGADNVKKETRDKVMRVIQDMGFRPNAFAQAMRTNQSGTVGVAVSRITNPIVPEILEALAAVLAAHRRRVVVWNTDTDGEDGLIAAMESGFVDGVIFTAASHQTDAMSSALNKKIPVVSINRYIETVECDQIVSTNYTGGQRIAEYLVSCGRERIAFINGPIDRTTLADREAGFREGMALAGRTIPPEHYSRHEFNAGAFRQVAMDLGTRSSPPDAIVCGNDLIAIEVLNGLCGCGVSVPDDIWVTGFDGIEMTGWDIISLTTMRQPLELMAANAARVLIDRIEGRSDAPKTIEYTTELIIRGSTANQRI